jgi:hypothetical protein
MTRLEASHENYDIDEHGIMAYAHEHFQNNNKDGRWNGCQIRNAFQTAIALADFDAKTCLSTFTGTPDTTAASARGRPRVTVKHFQQVAKAASMFDHYLKEVHGGLGESDLSSKRSERKDDYGQPPLAQMAPPVGRQNGTI